MADNTNRGFTSNDDNMQNSNASQSGQTTNTNAGDNEFTSDDATLTGRKGGETRTGAQQNQVGNTNTQQNSGLSDDISEQQTNTGRQSNTNSNTNP